MSISKSSIDPTIPSLGASPIPSRLPYTVWSDEKKVPIYIDEGITNVDEPFTLDFELAGPRSMLHFRPENSRCAVITCGGLCPGLNDVIRALVMEAFHAYHVTSFLGFRYGLEGLIPKYGWEPVQLTPDKVKDIHMFGGTVLGSSRGPQSPQEIVDTLERHHVNMLFIIGGDGTMRAANLVYHEIARRKADISIIGIPKTIDNDINFIPQSFGYETAASKAVDAISSAHIEANGAPYGIGIVKLMGRESGFIAGRATLAMKDVNYVLVPEAPFQLEGEGGLLPDLEKRLRERLHAVIVVAEGAGQHLLPKSAVTDASGNAKLGNIGGYLQDAIRKYFAGSDVRPSVKYIDPSYIIRSVPAMANDKIYCGFLGQHAVHAAMAGRTGMVVAKLRQHFVHLPLELVSRERRRVNLRSTFWSAVLESTGQYTLAGMLPEQCGLSKRDRHFQHLGQQQQQ